MAKIIFEDTPLPTGTVFFENAVPEKIPNTVSNAGPQGSVDETKPFIGYPRFKGSEDIGRNKAEAVTKQQEFIAEIATALGGNFDPSGELDDKVLRFDLGRSDKFSERKAKFQTRYKDENPNLQYLQVRTKDGSLVDVYRLDRNEPFKPVKNLRDTTFGDVTQAAGSVVNEQTLAAVGAAALSRGTSLTTRMGATGISLYAGGRLQSGIEGVRGYEHTPEAELQQRLLIDSGIGAIVETMMPGTGLVATLKDKVTKPMVGAERATLAGERQGLEQLSVGQLASSPVTRQAFYQAGGTSPVVENLTTKQRTSVHKKLEDTVQQKGFDGLSDTNLQRLIQEQQNELDAILRKSAISKSQTGQELQDAIQQWEQRSRAARDAMYKRAMRFGQKVEFDIAPMKARAIEIERGYLARAAEEGAEGVQVNPPGKLLGPTLERLRNMHPVVTEYTQEGVKYNALQQMIFLRDELHSIMRNSPNPAERKAASELWGLSKTAMEDPLGGDRRFLFNYNRAKQAHIDREELLDKAYIKAGLDKAEPGQLTNLLLKPGNEQTIKHIREIAGPNTWGRVKEYKKNELISDPASIQKLFDDFANDKPALDAFFSPDEQILLRAFYGRWQQTQTPTVQKMISDQRSLAERAIDLATKGKEGELRNVIELAQNAGVDVQNSLKAGIYQHVLNEASTVEAAAGGRLIDPQKLIYTVDQLRKKPALAQFMGPDDWQRLEDLQIYSDVIRGGMDMGGSLQRGAIVGKATAIFHPWKQASAARQITENEIVANILAEPVAYQKLVQARQAATQNGQIARLSQAVGLVAKRLSRPNAYGPAAAVGTQNYLEQE